MLTVRATSIGGRSAGCPALRLRWSFRALVLLVVTACSWPAKAQDGFIDREPQIKAAYLYQFVRYVQWPSDCFPNDEAPLVIGAVGDDPVNQQLRLIAQKRTAGQRQLGYQPVTTAEQAARCHILFFSDSTDAATRAALLAGIGNSPVLLVGEGPGFVTEGGIISFVIVDNKVRLRLSMKAATDHQLKISSQLAKLAEVVN